MEIRENTELAGFTTFRVGGKARYVATVKSEADVREALRFAAEKRVPVFVLGGGSNLVVSDAGFPGLVMKMELAGMQFDGETVTVAAGEKWDSFVEETVTRGLWGLENLSGIPGTVGASPVQNIGAYGTEVKDVIASVTALNIETGTVHTFSNEECRFAYRDSFFKTSEGKKFIILSVVFRLSMRPTPNLTYKDLREHFAEAQAGGTHPTQSDIRKAVLAIRARKFPDLSTIGTAGSFWKNPIISEEQFSRLKETYPDMPSFPAGGDSVKISLAWMLDKACGLKGYSRGRVALFQNQPLVLVAEFGATAAEIAAFHEEVKSIVAQKTGLSIEPEVGFLA